MLIAVATAMLPDFIQCHLTGWNLTFWGLIRPYSKPQAPILSVKIRFFPDLRSLFWRLLRLWWPTESVWSPDLRPSSNVGVWWFPKGKSRNYHPRWERFWSSGVAVRWAQRRQIALRKKVTRDWTCNLMIGLKTRQKFFLCNGRSITRAWYGGCRDSSRAESIFSHSS